MGNSKMLKKTTEGTEFVQFAKANCSGVFPPRNSAVNPKKNIGYFSVYKTSGIRRVSAALLLFFLLSCENPMVNYLLGERKKSEEWIDTSPVALWNGTWYYSLKEVVDAVPPNLSVPPIEIRRNITRSNAMGGNSITIPADKDIQLKPYTPDTIVTIRRWEAGGAFFTVEPGASLALGKGMAIDGALIVSSGPLVKVEGGAFFTMEDGSLVTRGRSSVPGDGVYIEAPGTFTMEGSARVADTGVYSETGCTFIMKDNAHAADVYLETGAKITLDGILSENPVARITPAAYTAGEEVLDGISLPLDISDNNEKFDVTPEEPVPGWSSPRHWRVDNDGKLYITAARRFAGGLNVYYPSLQDAFDAAYGAENENDFETVTLIANIDLAGNDKVTVAAGHYICLTVPAGNTYTIKRAQNATESMFIVSIGGGLKLEAPPGTQLILDGGAVWDSGTPAEDAVNIGVTSEQALVSVSGMYGFITKFILRSGVVLQNNDRTTGNGGAVESTGLFEMYGGFITSNRTAGNGGGIYFNKDNGDALLAGGSITGNDAGLSGGGIMLYLYSGKSKLTMTGGLISGNKAGGKDSVSVSSSMGGYGGGIFIPGYGSSDLTRNEFHLEGGTIRDNISASGKGNGIAIDFNNTSFYYPPEFTIKENASITGNDILLHVNSSSYSPPLASKITVDGQFNPSTPVLVTLDNYATLPMPVLTGSFDLSKFTAESPYSIDASGRIN
jgi:hypothetical protein